MATCTNPLRASDCEKPRQTERVCLRFSQPLASQGLGTSHPYESLNLGNTQPDILAVSFLGYVTSLLGECNVKLGRKYRSKMMMGHLIKLTPTETGNNCHGSSMN